ncbi:MAG TPA: carboxypeptidase regulatory-like domain-containing protein [Gemmatimonadaceae bacterium]|nr:carboxypeptidase regulatory-like domain-containing protein [Gemmatimonadaceae bacterium]
MTWRAIVAGAFGACAVLASCGNDDASRAARAGGNGGPPRIPYREIVVSNGGRISGTVALAPETTTNGATAQDNCGIFPRRARARRGDETRALVWLADIHSGKPVPAEKRFTVTTEHCELEPRVQGVLAGGTLNVLNTDPVEHRTRFLGAGDRVLAVITQFDAGQLVPRTDLLATPGTIEIRCDAHAWTRGWIHVFDHPYFAQVRADGGFSLDSIPPGDYRLMLWQEGMGTRERQVTVRSGDALRVDLDGGR